MQFFPWSAIRNSSKGWGDIAQTTQRSANARGGKHGGHMEDKNTFFRFHVYCRSFMIPLRHVRTLDSRIQCSFDSFPRRSRRVQFAFQSRSKFHPSLSAHKLRYSSPLSRYNANVGTQAMWEVNRFIFYAKIVSIGGYFLFSFYLMYLLLSVYI